MAPWFACFILAVSVVDCSWPWHRRPAQPATDAARLTISLQDALERARANSPQFQSANISALLAHEDRVQSKAALLPSLNYFNQYIYTEGNGTPSGIFVANDGVHIYNSQAQVHGDIYAPGKRADYRRAIAAEAMARAKAEVAARGLVVTVVQSYYGLVAATRKLQYAQQSLREAQQFFDITQKQERGGESAHSDVVKAQIQLEQRQRDAQEADLAVEKSRVGLAVLLFPDFHQDFDVVDDLQSELKLPPFPEIQALGREKQSGHSRGPGGGRTGEVGRIERAKRLSAFAFVRLLLWHRRQSVRH